MKGKTLIAAMLTAGLIGTAPVIALADNHGQGRDERNYRQDSRDNRSRQQNRRDDRGQQRNVRGDHDRHDRPKRYREPERVRVGKQAYYYREGRFFRPGPRGWISVQAPVGAIVATLPLGFSMTMAGGNVYFQVGGSFYSRVSNGYMVVETPAFNVAPSPRPSSLPGRVTVRPSLMNIRSGPGMNFAISGQVISGQRLHVRGSSNGWYYVEQPNGNYGWVMMSLTLP